MIPKYWKGYIRSAEMRYFQYVYEYMWKNDKQDWDYILFIENVIIIITNFFKMILNKFGISYCFTCKAKNMVSKRNDELWF